MLITMNRKILTFLSCMLVLGVYAQDGQVQPIDTLADYVQKMNNTFTPWSKLKFSGYIQTQFQKADEKKLEEKPNK